MPFVEKIYLPPEKDEVISEYIKTVFAVTGEEITKAKAIERLLYMYIIKEETKRIKNLL